MDSLTLQAEKRTILGKKVRALRREGLLPAVLYFHGHESIPLTLSTKEFGAIYKAAGESALIDVVISGEKPRKALIQEVSVDAVKSHLIHTNLREIAMNEELTTMIPLVLIGESPAVKNNDGILLQAIHEVEVTCLPANLPHEIEVDISNLVAIDDAVYIRDLTIPAKVTLSADPDEVIVKIDEQREEEVAEEVAEADLVAGVEASAEKATEADSE